MVAPIGNTANKFIFPLIFSTTITSHNLQTFLPTVKTCTNTGMDKSTGTNPVTNNETRGRSSQIKKNLSKNISMSSTRSSVIYHERVTMSNSMDIDSDPPTESPVLSYEEEQEKELCLRKVAETTNNMRPQGGNNEAFPFQVNHSGHIPTDRTCGLAPCDDDDNVINIQLPYNPNVPMEPELWSGNFHPISLHGSIKQVALNMKSIKDLLNFIAKYISNKKVNSNTVNDLADFDGMGNAIWNFISLVYEAKWNSLYTDNKANNLRAKVASKFTLRTSPQNNGNKKDIAKLAPVTINKVPPPPPLLAKTKKEVNIISKYFHPKKPSVENTTKGNNVNPEKSYAQASKSSVSTSDVLKIKETFLFLNVQKIDQVNSIVNGQNKSKSQIRMTTKELSRK